MSLVSARCQRLATQAMALSDETRMKLPWEG
jgi:hypothetical protein